PADEAWRASGGRVELGIRGFAATSSDCSRLRGSGSRRRSKGGFVIERKLTGRDARTSVEALTLAQLLRMRAFESPAFRAYTFLPDGEREAATLTFGELHRRALTIAAGLRSVARPGGRALLLYPPGLDYVCGFFGCLYAGVVAVPLYPLDPSRARRSLPRLL